jgi:hypothetical protein
MGERQVAADCYGSGIACRGCTLNYWMRDLFAGKWSALVIRDASQVVCEVVEGEVVYQFQVKLGNACHQGERTP